MIYPLFACLKWRETPTNQSPNIYLHGKVEIPAEHIDGSE